MATRGRCGIERWVIIGDGSSAETPFTHSLIIPPPGCLPIKRLEKGFGLAVEINNGLK